MTETNRSQFKKTAAALAVASCLSLTPWLAEAAGLGKLTVFSGLGQPLRAELEIGGSRDELAGMTARLAPQDAFKQAGVDFASVLYDLRLSVEKRANGQAVVKVTSAKPVNEPFLDFLVELNWPAGRLVREYTFLLDPPEIAAKGASGAVSVAEAKVLDTVRGGSVATRQPTTTRAPRSAPKAVAETKPAESAFTRVVQPGETLRKIAGETKYDGVSLEQMLVGLFQNNPDAFIGKNINRLKSGAILGIPEKSAVESVTEADAKKVYVTQSSDWNAYRQKLASAAAKAPSREEAASQVASGKITAKVEDKVAPAEQSKDQVKVSKTEMAGKGAAKGGASEADLIAKDRALKEAQDRLALLEKNVGELQKLVEMKTQKLAELQQAAAKKEEPKPAEPVKAPEPPKAVEAPKAAEVPKAAEPAKVEEAPKPAEEAKPVEAPKPAPVAPEPPKPPVAEKKPLPPPPPPPEEPGLLDSLLEDPLPLAGGGGILALLAGYFLYKRRRDTGASQMTTTAPGPSSLGPNSVFRMTGGQSVDTGNTPPQTGDFSQTGPGTIDTDEVDPVAEADVYMAYGRDTQAEEILLEALQKDPQRTAIHAKLLEIYANRKSVKQFDTLASELYAQTGGAGPDWDKVAALGAALDPNNPLYSGAQVASTKSFDADATMVASPEAIAKATQAMSGGFAQMPEMVEPVTAPAETPSAEAALFAEAPEIPVVPEETPTEPEVELASEVMSLDFDLGEPAAAGEPAAEPTVTASFDSSTAGDGNALDFDLGSDEIAGEPEIGELKIDEDFSISGSDLDFGLESSPTATPAQAAAGLVQEAGESAEADPDFSPEGTMVMSHQGHDEFGGAAEDVFDVDLEEAMEAAASTYVGGDAAKAEKASDEPAVSEPAVDFDLELGDDASTPPVSGAFDGDATATIVTPLGGEAGNILSPLEDEASTTTMLNPLAMQPADLEFDDPALAATSLTSGGVNDSLEFDVKLTDSVSLDQTIVPPDFDIGSINLDLSAEPEAAPLAAEAPGGAHDAAWEEANTKLDLAKAYEEMGDLEGARELLQEVIGEGPADLVEQARAVLGRIGE